MSRKTTPRRRSRPWVLVYGDGRKRDPEITIELFEDENPKQACMAKVMYVRENWPHVVILGYGRTEDGDEALRLLNLYEKGIRKDEEEKGS